MWEKELEVKDKEMQLQLKLKEVELQKVMSSPSESPPITSTSFDAEVKLLAVDEDPVSLLEYVTTFKT